LRSTPNGSTLGDGLVPQIWFGCALLTLAVPHKVWCLMLLAVAGLLDFWWRLPVTASLYFHAVVSGLILFAALCVFAKPRSLWISPSAFIESFRAPLLGLLVVLFCVSAFHKLTRAATYSSVDFFRLLGRYYVPFLPASGGPRLLMWFFTVAGEATIGATLLFRQTRLMGLVLGVGFACLVGSIVYGLARTRASPRTSCDARRDLPIRGAQPDPLVWPC